ncbi:uncharacterized protein IL334_005161 [Kwoniella shivajii]|uniref:Extracellular membrane protein CFEM domain-containing protein n=1 Tax=Kwoniella shivajii TaxID=564305 RepID=A0ABZ1D2D3_9TREE|nr:hypothetical protein IL334_005161 [Kwoniella shivajii]
MFKAAIISILVASAALVSSTRIPGVCYQDNCYRAVQRTWQGPAVFAQHVVQCNSALSCVSTPAASTTTASTTVTAGTVTITVSKETNTPAPVAAVLSCPTAGVPSDQTDACENSFVSYSSACSCNPSASATTSVFATPTITATVTTTVPASIVYV